MIKGRTKSFALKICALTIKTTFLAGRTLMQAIAATILCPQQIILAERSQTLYYRPLYSCVSTRHNGGHCYLWVHAQLGLGCVVRKYLPQTPSGSLVKSVITTIVSSQSLPQLFRYLGKSINARQLWISNTMCQVPASKSSFFSLFFYFFRPWHQSLT